MPGLASEGDSSGGENIVTLDTLGGHLVLKTGNAVDIFVVGNNEGLGSNLTTTNIESGQLVDRSHLHLRKPSKTFSQ